MSETNGVETNPVERIVMCDCYPEHCTDGTPCWCEPEIYDIEGTKIIVHREVH